MAAVSVTLRWTAPGDDGMVGRAKAYVLRYSTAPITDANFANATPVAAVPAPMPAGSLEAFQVTGLVLSTGYYFALKAVDAAGNWSGLSNVLFVPGPAVGLEDQPLTLAFSAPWPNPARASVHWAFALPEPIGFHVDVFDLAGRHVRNLASRDHLVGRGELEWDLRDGAGTRVAAGTYLVRARLGEETWIRRVAVVP